MATRTLALPSERWQSRDMEMLLFLRPGEQRLVMGSGQHGCQDLCLGRWTGGQGVPHRYSCVVSSFSLSIRVVTSFFSCEPDGWLIHASFWSLPHVPISPLVDRLGVRVLWEQSCGLRGEGDWVLLHIGVN